MSARVTAFLDPAAVPAPFHWEGPDIYRVQHSYVSDLLIGDSAEGALIYQKLSPDKRRLLEPSGWRGDDALPLLDAATLKNVLLEVYDYYGVLYIEHGSPANPEHMLTLGKTVYFNQVKQDVAGLVLVCDRAITRECNVLLTLS